jgi:hypothetical protein
MGASGSKESFTTLVQRLQEAEVLPSEHEVWDELWKSSLSAEVSLLMHIHINIYLLLSGVMMLPRSRILSCIAALTFHRANI